MADHKAVPADDDREVLETFGELLAAGHLLDIVVAIERATQAADASDDEAGDDEVVTGEAR